MNGIEITGVCVSYNGTRAVDELKLTVSDRAWVSLIGPNGSGKSTLLRAVAGIVGYSGGIALHGKDTKQLPRRELAKMIALVPQTPVIPPGMSVLDYVLMGRTPYIPYLGSESATDLQVTASVLEKLDLTGFAPRAIDSLSGGELQRVLFARALVQEAPFLLLDEPTTGLDVGHQQEVLELVDTLRRERGLTVLSAMHDLTVAGQFADELVLLDAGTIVASGPPASVLTEEIIRRHYRAAVKVLHDSGEVIVIPVRR